MPEIVCRNRQRNMYRGTTDQCSVLYVPDANCIRGEERRGDGGGGGREGEGKGRRKGDELLIYDARILYLVTNEDNDYKDFDAFYDRLQPLFLPDEAMFLTDAYLGQLTIDYASLSRRSGVPTPNRDTSNSCSRRLIVCFIVTFTFQHNS